MALPTQLARDLLPIVNVPQTYELVVDYAKHRIEKLRSELELCANMEQVLRIQGSIAELRKILTLKDEVNADSKRKE